MSLRFLYHHIVFNPPHILLKSKHRRLAKASAAFNESARDKEWIAELERLGVVPNPATPESIANFLYSSSEKLDQAKIGEYISKGPKEKYPFIEKVLYHFAQLFDFSELSFSESLRLFLSTFRLPGEAQCIDRLMEAFAQRLYEGHNSCNADDNAAKTMLDPPRHALDGETNSRSGLIDPPTDENNHVLFKSADAAFILGERCLCYSLLFTAPITKLAFFHPYLIYSIQYNHAQYRSAQP